MKQGILIFCILFSISWNKTFAQDYSDLEKISLKDRTECADNEKLVLECSNYVLESPLNVIEKDENRLSAMKFIMRWMEATPDYSFSLDESMGKATSSNPTLLAVLLAAMSQYALENKTDDANDVKYNSFITFIKYCEDPDNKVKLNEDLKELIKARDENNLKEFLRIRSTGVIAIL